MMHELPITEKILNIVAKHAQQNQVSKVISITLSIGDLSDIENEWMQHYFNYLSKGTVAEGALLRVERVPIVLKCNKCGHSIEIQKSELGDITCPQCSEARNFSIESGKEYYIKEMEVQ